MGQAQLKLSQPTPLQGKSRFSYYPKKANHVQLKPYYDAKNHAA
jgi:hypothetical protein